MDLSALAPAAWQDCAVRYRFSGEATIHAEDPKDALRRMGQWLISQADNDPPDWVPDAELGVNGFVHVVTDPQVA